MNLFSTLDAISMTTRIDETKDAVQKSSFPIGGDCRTWYVSAFALDNEVLVSAYVARLAENDRPMRRLAIANHIAEINARQPVQFYTSKTGTIGVSASVPWGELEPDQLDRLIRSLVRSAEREYPQLLATITGSSDLDRLAGSFAKSDEEAL